MAFSPFMQSSQAQTVINDYLDGKMEPVTNVNSAGNFRNPLFDLRTEQELAGELDPSALYPNPQLDFSTVDAPIDPCPEGYMLVDGVCQPIETFGESIYQENTGDNDENIDGRSESRKIYDEMKKDPELPFGAEKIIEKYKIGEDEDGNAIYNFDPNVGSGFGALKFIDMLFGGGKNREKKYNTAINTLLNQTKSNFFPNSNPLAFGNQSGDLFTMYSPQNYLNQVGDVVIPGSNQGATMNELLATVGQGTQGTGDGYVAPTQQVNSGQQGTQVSNTSGSSLFNNGVFNPVAHQAQIAQNIATNLSNTDPTTGSPHSNKSTGSGCSTSLGGFYKGR